MKKSFKLQTEVTQASLKKCTESRAGTGNKDPSEYSSITPTSSARFVVIYCMEN